MIQALQFDVQTRCLNLIQPRFCCGSILVPTVLPQPKKALCEMGNSGHNHASVSNGAFDVPLHDNALLVLILDWRIVGQLLLRQMADPR